MRITKLPLTILAISIIVCSCNTEEQPTYLEGYEKVVVNAFLYENELVDDIRITRLVTYDESGDDSNFLNDLEPVIEWNGEIFPLEPYPGDTGYYHYTREDLQIKSGEAYEIRFLFENEEIHASTVVPGPPARVSMDIDTLYTTKLLSFEDRFNQVRPEPILLSWENPDAEYYYFVIESLDEDAELINQIDRDSMPFGREMRRFLRVTEPTDADFYQIQTMSLTYFGRYMVKVIRANDEFAEMFETSGQDSRDLNEPFSNIENGLGIFTGFTTDTLHFHVMEE